MEVNKEIKEAIIDEKTKVQKLNKIMNFDQIFNNSIIVLECLNILFLNFYSTKGFNLYNTIPSFIIATLFFAIKFFKYKEKIKLNLIDCIVMLFPFTFLIPILAGTYATLKGSICGAVYGFTLFSIYMVIRNIKDKNKMLSYFADTLIITNVLYIIIGIDIRSSNVVTALLKKVFNLSIELQGKERFTTVLAYINANAIFALVAYFVSVYKYLITEKRLLKNIYLGITNIFLAYLILTYSKMVIGIGGTIILIVLILAIKNKALHIRAIQRLIVNNIIFAIVIVMGYTKFINLNKYAIWIYMAGVIIVYTIYAIIYEKIRTKIMIRIKNRENTTNDQITTNDKITINNQSITIKNNTKEEIEKHSEGKYKKIISIAGFVILCICLIAIITDLIIGKPAIVSKKGNNAGVSFLDAKQGEDCKFEFYFKITGNDSNNENIDEGDNLNKSSDNDTLFTITIVEQNEFNGTNSTNSINIRSQDKEASINIPVKQDTIRINVQIKKINEGSSKLEVYKTIIGGKNVNLDYRFIPKRIVSSIQSVFHKSFSMNERFVGIKDGIKIGSENFLTGTGDYSWRYIKLKGQTYNYGCTDVHCYPIVIFVENGIVGFLVILAVACLTMYFTIKYIKKIMENKKAHTHIKNNINIKNEKEQCNDRKYNSNQYANFWILFLTIIPIVIHSLLDFDLSINIIKILLVTLVALYINELEKNQKISNVKNSRDATLLEIILIIIFIATIILNITVFPRYTSDNIYTTMTKEISSQKEDDYEQKLQILDEYIKKEPYNNRVNVLSRYNTILKQALKNNKAIGSSSSNIVTSTITYRDAKKYIENYYKYLSQKLYKWNFSNEISRLKYLKEFSQILEETYENTGDEYYKEMREKFVTVFNSDYEKLLIDAKNYKCYLSNENSANQNVKRIEELKKN